MALDITGRLIQVLPHVTGEGRNGTPWQKQEFIIETIEQYPRKVCLSLWGDKVNELKKFALNDTITASLNLESREYNGRWFTEARAWRMELGAGTPASGGFAQPTAPAQAAYAPPAAPAQAPATPSPLPEPLQSFGDDDDLPF